MLRWNELMLQLVARANLPPAPNPDGTYPVPDATNPFADPVFPFGNPPYAARAYSYVAVAQYEALKAAWHFKYLYNRPAPSKVDSSIQALIPTDVPAYPSEDAVMSGVNAELMRLLFPAYVELITLKAGEQRQAALLSGKATASDIAAGVALGRAIAAVFVARAASDGMGAAGGSPALWATLPARAAVRGDIPWQSMDIPARPPMLPFFGNVRAWMLTPEQIVAERPGPPPATSSPLMAQELAEVRKYVDRGTREELAIANFWADGPSTPTPPGHWMFIAAPHIRKAEYSEVRAARAFALVAMVAARRRRRLLGDEVLLLQPASLAPGSRAQIDHRPAELSFVHVGTLDLLGGGGRNAVVPLPEQPGRVREAEGRSLNLAVVRRHPLPVRSRGGQGTRQAAGGLHREVRANRRRRSLAPDHDDRNAEVTQPADRQTFSADTRTGAGEPLVAGLFGDEKSQRIGKKFGHFSMAPGNQGLSRRSSKN